jgi:HEAT repeat protein
MKKIGSFKKKEDLNGLAGRAILILFLLWWGLLPNILSGWTLSGDKIQDSKKVTAAEKPSALAEEKIAAWLRLLPASDRSQTDRIFGEMIQTVQSGTPVVSQLASRLQAPGKGDDNLVRYALDGLVQAAAKKGPAALKEKVAGEILKAVVSQPETQIKAFLLSEAGYIVEAKEIRLVEPYLLIPELADEAVRTLLRTKSPEVEKALLKAWPRAPLEARLSLLQGLGELRSKKAVPLIKPLAVAGDPKVRLMALSALAEIADPATEALFSELPVLSTEEEKKQTIGLYLRFARRLSEDGQKDRALAIARQACQVLVGEEEVAQRSEALELVADILQEKSLPDITKAVADENKEYRATALRLARKFDRPEMTPDWLKALKEAESAAGGAGAVADLIAFLGERQDKTVLPEVVKFLGSQDEGVRLAAIRASFRLGGKEILDKLWPLLANSPIDCQLILDLVATLKPEDYMGQLIKIYPGLPEASKPVVLNAVRDKMTPAWKEIILGEIDSPIAELSRAAAACLSSVCAEGDLPWLLEKYATLEDTAVAAGFQAAIKSVMGDIKDEGKRLRYLLTSINKSKGKARASLIRLLPLAGGQAGLKNVLAFMSDKDQEIKAAAIYALTSWPGFEAAPLLINLLSSTQDRKVRYLACQGLVRLVKEAEVSTSEKLKILEQMKPLVSYPDERSLLLTGWASRREVKALEEIAGFFDDESLRERAALSACRLARPQAGEEGLKGRTTIWILKKALLLLDDELEIQETENYLDSLLRQEGLEPLFNRKDLYGWKGLVGDPVKRAGMSQAELAAAQKKADEIMRQHWQVIDGVLVFDGRGESLCTAKDFCDFELFVDWKIEKGGDSGIYLRGSPQVQIWDPAQWPEGSGGLYNNEKNPNKPLKCADRPVGSWNTFYIKMVGERVTVYLNGELVVDNVIMENYWERDKPIYPCGQIELQAHNTPLYFKNIYLKELTSVRSVESGKKKD